MLLLVLVTLQGWKQLPAMSYLPKDVFLSWEGTGTAAELVTLGKVYWACGSVNSCKSGQHVEYYSARLSYLSGEFMGTRQKDSISGTDLSQETAMSIECHTHLEWPHWGDSIALLCAFLLSFSDFLMFIPCKLERDKRYPLIILKLMRSGRRWCLNIPPWKAHGSAAALLLAWLAGLIHGPATQPTCTCPLFI